jgi:hypothetical protein
MEKGKHIAEKTQFPWKHDSLLIKRNDSLAYLHSRVDDLNSKLELLKYNSNKSSNCNAYGSMSHEFSSCSKEKPTLGWLVNQNLFYRNSSPTQFSLFCLKVMVFNLYQIHMCLKPI